ncbi:PAS domain S-box-containing protein [Pseudoxanthobacter soli DSM 19599]|uniref:Blue-light-activated histidine kinase n=1 Tax=Pseudoxanthobacter soli DSM 19599 TaxID=1123029 RepID=A0A1M7Z8R6_9HYPH|nr:PAS domain-containing protein [Pseudoxanthobacter soli]SHO61106.1 PAS domain S-box-containing protein [Pseudoxanthobacter soli DSM 19599]
MPVSLFHRLDSNINDRLASSVMLHQIRDFDWASSPVGPIDRWSSALRSAARTMLLSSTPMVVLIGRMGLLVYNDAAREMFGPGYEGSLGRPVAEVLGEAAEFYGTVIDAAFEGTSSSFRDQPFRLRRDGSREISWLNLDFTPIVDETGTVYGVLLLVNETTERVLAVRDLQRSRARLDLALDAGGIVGTWELDFATETVTCDERSARLYGIDLEAARTGAPKATFLAGIHPEDRDRFIADFDSARFGQHFRCQHRVIGQGDVRWVVNSGRVVADASGRPLSFSGVVVDVTHEIETAEALAASELRFRTFTEALPHVVFSWQPGGQIDYFNQRWREFLAVPSAPATTEEWEACLHPSDRASVFDNWRESARTGEPFDIEARYRHRSGEFRWGRVIALPIRDTHGRIGRWIATLTDIHEAKLLESERELVTRELDHRLKNIFAVVNGLVSLTLREDVDVGARSQSFAERLRGRLGALDSAHGFIKSAGTDRRNGSSLQELVRELLAPYDAAGDGGRLVLEGDDIRVADSAMTPLALIFHELATNAAKYGALSMPGGAIRLHSLKNGNALKIVWHESVGTETDLSAKESGFGSKLLTLVIEGQLRGRLQREATPDGFRIAMELPFEGIARPAG